LNGYPGALPREHHHRAVVQRVIGVLLMFFSASMLPPLGIALGYGDGAERAFMLAFFMVLASGFAVWYPARKARGDLRVRDGVLITVLFWSVLGLMGALPFWIVPDAWNSWTDAIFESMSGLTTTGATVVVGIDHLPHALKFYRCELQFLGGMGILVLAVAIMPMLGVGGMQLVKAETAGPMKDARLAPRIAQTARALWLVYVGLTAVCTITYRVLGMDWFDAICHAMTTIATGGFSTHDASIGYFNNPLLEYVVSFFLVIGAINFGLHFLALRGGGLRIYWRDEEFRAYVAITLVLIAAVCVPLALYGPYQDDYALAFRRGLFQVIAFGTTAGYATDDPSRWPSYVPILLVLASYFAAMASSTAAGFKTVRVVLLFKQGVRELTRLVHPSAEISIKLNGRRVSDSVIASVTGFFATFVAVVAAMSLLLMVLSPNLDFLTAFSAVTSSINDLGPGLGIVNATMVPVSVSGKWLLIFGMLLGRLEIFTLLVVLTPAFWRK
jgi:trk system potassium uptake protein TrkH